LHSVECDSLVQLLIHLKPVHYRVQIGYLDQGNSSYLPNHKKIGALNEVPAYTSVGKSPTPPKCGIVVIQVNHKRPATIRLLRPTCGICT